MPIFEIDSMQVVERLPGWRGRYFHSATMTFAHYEFDCDARIHEHRHHAEEVSRGRPGGDGRPGRGAPRARSARRRRTAGRLPALLARARGPPGPRRPG